VIADRAGDDDGTEVVAGDLPTGTISAEDGTAIARVAADDEGSYVEFEDADELPAERTYQLWSLDGAEPVSLGVLGAGSEQDVRVTIPRTTVAVAISDEPAGGSPQPTGPIVGSGELALPS
jgi:anti-sigma-K factor RskA